MRLAHLALAGVLPALLMHQPASAQVVEERVPMIGQDGPEMDACGGIGRVSRLASGGRTHLPVRPNPSLGAAARDHLPTASLVWLCESDGEWQGIVYPSGPYQELGDCRVSIPLPEPSAYSGPCRHGWVEARFIDLVAG